MRKTITVRLTDEVAEWLEETAAKAGVSQGSLIRERLEQARAEGEKPFMRLAGKVQGPSRLSLRKGFSKR